MNYGLLTNLDFSTTDCLVLGLFGDALIPAAVETLNGQQDGLIHHLFAKLGNQGECIWHHGVNQPSLLITHLGDQKDYTAAKFNTHLTEALTPLLSGGFSSITVALPRLKEKSADWQLEKTVLFIDAFFYKLRDFKSTPCKTTDVQTVNLFIEHATDEALARALSIAKGITLTRTLANLPANICTPTYLADEAYQLSKRHKLIKSKIYNARDIVKMGMNTLMAVGQGSREEPRFIELSYFNGPKEKAPMVLIGKGITFDSGGISIKPAPAMEEMKYDMSGAASVLGALEAAASLNLPINLVGLIAAAENMPGGGAVKPGDIIKSYSGQFIEITNTDAEGRLVLADALTYAERFNPEFVIDIATLTGAVIIALGHVYSGLMTSDDALADMILEASQASLDKTWRLPLDDDYQEIMNSPIADMLNSSVDRSAGSITAACFLSRFAKKFRWAHLDIAGTAWISGKDRNATGRPVPLLMELLQHVATR